MEKILRYIAAFSLLAGLIGPHSGSATRTPADRVLSVLKAEADRLDQATRNEVADLVKTLAQSYALDPLLILAVMKVESRFDPKALSRARAFGLMQVRSIALREVCGDLGLSGEDTLRLFDHDVNLRVGVHYLSVLIRKFGGDLSKALMAYNSGPSTVSRLYRGRPVPSGGYQGRVLKAYRDYSQNL